MIDALRGDWGLGNGGWASGNSPVIPADAGIQPLPLPASTRPRSERAAPRRAGSPLHRMDCTRRNPSAMGRSMMGFACGSTHPTNPAPGREGNGELSPVIPADAAIQRLETHTATRRTGARAVSGALALRSAPRLSARHGGHRITRARVGDAGPACTRGMHAAAWAQAERCSIAATLPRRSLSRLSRARRFARTARSSALTITPSKKASTCGRSRARWLSTVA